MTDAHDTLSDPKRRIDYDNGADLERELQRDGSLGPDMRERVSDVRSVWPAGILLLTLSDSVLRDARRSSAKFSLSDLDSSLSEIPMNPSDA